MANVLFKRGLSTNLLSAGKTYEDGCFYLTTDTNHLYVGTSDNKLAKIDGNIRSVSSLPTTGEPGEFYYLPGQNILAYYDDSSKKWVQLNPDTDTDTKITGISMQKSETASTTERLVYDVKLKQQNIENANLDDITTQLVINSSDVTGILTDTAVDIEANENNGKVIVKTAGNGAFGDGFSITGVDGIDVSVVEGDIQITGTEYTMENDGANIKLKAGNEVKNTITLSGDNTWIETSSTNKGTIDIKHKGKSYNNTSNGNLTGAKETLTSQGTFNVITGIGYDNTGHIDSVTTSTMEMPEINYSLDEVTTTVGNNTVTTGIQLKNGNAVINEKDINVKYDITVDGVKTTVSNGNNLGTFYSASMIDGKLKAVNAMSYKGPINRNEDLPTITRDDNGNVTSTIKIGDTYKVNTAGTYNGYNCEIGYLLIANSTVEENNEGYIADGLYWDLIESGESSDTTYTLSGENNFIKLTDSSNASTSITVEDDDIVVLSVADNKLKGSHKNITATNTKNAQTSVDYEGTFETVSNISTDNYGHITGFTTDTIKLPAQDTIEADAANAKLTFKNSNAVQGSLDINAGTDLVVSGTADGKTNLIATIGHNTISRSDTQTTDSPVHEGTFTAVKSITTSDTGHITEVKTTTVTLPAETVYELNTPTLNSSNTVIQQLLANNEEAGSFKLTSNTITYTVDSNNIINANLVWGEF